MDETLFEGLEGLDNILADAKTETGSNKQPGEYKNKEPNLWDKTDIKPREIKLEDLLKADKSYTIALPDNRIDPPEDIIKLFVKLVTGLSDKGYTLRFNILETLELSKQILSIPNLKYKAYLPWPKYNTKVTNIAIKKPTELAYRVACYFVKNFNEKPAAIRCIESELINTMLGIECNTPVRFVLAYSECGTEVLGKDIDYSKVKNLPSVMRIAKKYQIPFINIKNQDSITKLGNLIKE